MCLAQEVKTLHKRKKSVFDQEDDTISCTASCHFLQLQIRRCTES